MNFLKYRPTTSLFVAMLLCSQGCRTTYRTVPGVSRRVTEPGPLVSSGTFESITKPSGDSPVLEARVKQYRKDSEMEVTPYRELEITEMHEITKLVLLPVYIAVGVFSFGEVDIYRKQVDTLGRGETKKFLGFKMVPVDAGDMDVMCRYMFAFEWQGQLQSRTNSSGGVSFNVEKPILRAFRNPQNREMVFGLSVPGLNLEQKIRVPEEILQAVFDQQFE